VTILKYEWDPDRPQVPPLQITLQSDTVMTLFRELDNSGICDPGVTPILSEIRMELFRKWHG
jgi:hypothetical protein